MNRCELLWGQLRFPFTKRLDVSGTLEVQLNSPDEECKNWYQPSIGEDRMAPTVYKCIQMFIVCLSDT